MDMKKYIGTKVITAKPMTRGEYNEFRGWTIPADENPADAGYLVKYTDGYISWSPAKQFEEAYHAFDGGMTFGAAIELMKMGFKLQRKGWNGKKQYIELISYRLTSPSLGVEVGSYERGYREFFQGLFIAPHVVAQAVHERQLVGEFLHEGFGHFDCGQCDGGMDASGHRHGVAVVFLILAAELFVGNGYLDPVFAEARVSEYVDESLHGLMVLFSMWFCVKIRDAVLVHL